MTRYVGDAAYLVVLVALVMATAMAIFGIVGR